MRANLIGPIANDVQQTSDGGYILGGQITNLDDGVHYDFSLIKTDAFGEVEWSKSFGGIGKDYGQSVIEAADGGFILCGYTVSFGAGASDVYVVKTDANGNLLWQKTFGGTDKDSGNSIIASNDGNYVIAGYSNSFSFGKRIYVLKMDTDGNVLWTKRFGDFDFSSQYGADIIQTNDGGYAITGNAYLVADIYLLKIDQNGDPEWTRYFTAMGDQWANTIIQSSDGGFVMAGARDDMTTVGGMGDMDIYVVKTDVNGNFLWDKSYGSQYQEEVRSIVETSDGEYLIGGWSQGFATSFDPAAITIKISDNGNLISSNRVVVSSHINSITLTNDGGYLYAGMTGTVDLGPLGANGNGSLLIVKTDGLGNNDCGELDINFEMNSGLMIDPVQFYNEPTGCIVAAAPAIENNLFAETYTICDQNPVCVSVNASVISQHEPCFNDCNGIINVTPTAGTGPYTYSWSPLVANSSDSIATGLCAGAYTVTITGTDGCDTTFSTILTEPPTLSASSSHTNPLCFGVNNGSINLDPVGGSGVYSYSWDNGQSIQDINDIGAGSYTVIIADVNGCEIEQTVVITEPSALFLGSSSIPSTCGLSDGSATVNAVGGTPGYSYQWNVLAGNQTTATATGLSSTGGPYTATVTDGNGCIDQINVAVTDQAGPTANTTSLTNVNCNGNSTGNATVTGSGGTGQLTYSWFPLGGTSSSATNLPANNYTVTITDSNGCTIQEVVAITEPVVLTSSAVKLNPDCNGDNSGFIDLTVNGGTAGYSYSWDNGETTQDISSLSAGSYTVDVTDNNGCTTQQVVVITEPDALSLNLSATMSTCTQTDGSATVFVSGGSGGYLYSWDDSLNQQSAIASNLPSGTYSVTVVDGNGCMEMAQVTVIDIGAPILSISSSQNISCAGFSDGSASATASGSGPLLYQWNDQNNQITTTASNLSAGTYQVLVTDTNNCIAIEQVTITEPTLLSGILTSSSASCGNSDGQASVEVSGGTAGYGYIWDNNISQSTSSIDTLIAGSHTVTITDKNGCDTTISFAITNVNAPTLTLSQPVNLLCYGDSNATIIASQSGGTAPFNYQWNDPQGQTTSVADNLPAGTYQVTVIDDNNCIAQQSYTITEPEELLGNLSKVNATCDNSNGSAEVISLGGTGPITYEWDDPQSATTSIVTGLQEGSYSVIITDQNGCFTSKLITISMASSIPVVLAWPDTTIAEGASVPLSSSGGINCLWIPSIGLNNPTECNPIATPEKTTTYAVIVTDQNGCKNTDSLTIIVDEGYLVLYIPNSFTPNGDAINEFFEIKGSDIDYYNLQIYDRWGELIFESNHLDNSWDGRAYGKREVQMDTYPYRLQISGNKTEPTSYVGYVTVIR